jgi:hypothetical protein
MRVTHCFHLRDDALFYVQNDNRLRQIYVSLTLWLRCSAGFLQGLPGLSSIQNEGLFDGVDTCALVAPKMLCCLMRIWHDAYKLKLCCFYYCNYNRFHVNMCKHLSYSTPELLSGKRNGKEMGFKFKLDCSPYVYRSGKQSCMFHLWLDNHGHS